MYKNMQFVKQILAISVVVLVALGGFFYGTSTVSTPPSTFGADTQLFLGGAVYTLSGSGISSSGTSIGLTSLTIPQNGYLIQDSDLSSTFYVTLEPGNTAKQEFASCTTVVQNAGGTATLSGCTRGLSPIAPYTASTTLQFSHGGGTKLIFSNSPQLYDQAAFKGNDETITGLWTFPSADGTRPVIGADTDTAVATAFVTFGQLSRQAIAGAANASETVKGLVELATANESASSTILGATGAGLVQQARYATDTPQDCIGANKSCDVWADLNGKIKQAFLNLDEAFTLTNAVTIPASVSFPLTLNTVAYNFPSSQGASSTVATNNGSGTIRWITPQVYTLFANFRIRSSTSSTATTTHATLTIPANTLTASSHIRINAEYDTTPGRVCQAQVDWGNGSATNTPSSLYVPYYGGASSNSNAMTIDITLIATSTGSGRMTGRFNQESSGTYTYRYSSKQINIDTTGQTYLAFRMRNPDGLASCDFDGYSAEVINY